MKEKTLLKIALICSLVGIVVLFFVSEKISISQVDLDRIDERDIGTDVKIIGRIERATDTEKVMFLEIGQEKIEKVTVILFKDSDISLKEGDYVEITGEIEDYNGKREIIANKVRIV